jgi:hypothetical protein
MGLNMHKTICQYCLLLLLCIAANSCRKEQETVLSVDFDYEIVANNYQVPVRIAFTNKSTGTQTYKWTFEGGTPATYDKREPGTITFTKPGSITVSLEAGTNTERLTKTVTILLDTVLKANFNIVPVLNNIAPVALACTNTCQGATKYNWQFEGGTPATSTAANPSGIMYTTPGTYKVFLEALNNRGLKDTISKWFTVLPPLAAGFDIVPSFDDDDYEAPLTATLQNKTISATTHKWSVVGGVINKPNDSITTVYFANPGTYQVSYEASNGKATQTVTQTITVKPNTGMRSFTNVKLGINTAHSTLGAFFSTTLRQVFKQSEVNSSNGAAIDICYFGLSENYTYNRFISPDTVQAFTFPAITGATNTQFVNQQEKCGCSYLLTSTGFDNCTTGTDLDAIQLSLNSNSVAAFSDAIVPRIVLFKNAKGKKGAIRINSFVKNGTQSYILCDIKVQKD